MTENPRKRRKTTEKIKKFIIDYYRKNHRSPSIREIARALGIASTSTVYFHLQKLQKEGFIELKERIARNIVLKEDATENIRRMPVLGAVRAGKPVFSAEDIEGYIPLPESSGFASGDFLLRIKGDSMIEEGILDGDLVIVKQTQSIEQGQIGVFVIDGEATIKKFGIIDGRPALMPANPAYEIIFPDDLYVVGVVTGLIRRYR